MGADHPERSIYIDGKNGAIALKVGGSEIALTTGGESGGGPVITLKHAGASTVLLDGNHVRLTLGGSVQTSPGQISLMANNGHSRIFLDAADGNVYIGGNGMGGDLFLYPKEGSFLLAEGATTAPSIQLSGDTGDILLAKADCAEEFDIAEEDPVDPGTVMVMHTDGRLARSRAPYDKRVAGDVAGAAGHRPGIILGKQVTQSHRLPIGLVGRLSCKVDADYTPIAVGDLLTTSPTPGHAMKATDSSQAFGAVLGKAMAALATGRELLPILIALQ